MMVVGLVGFIGSGKGTAGDILTKIGFQKHSFAGPLKDAVSVIFGWDREMLEGETKESRAWREQPDEFWSKVMGRPYTPREALQKMGTEAGRNIFHNDLWIEALQRRIKGNTVITDVRFQNEMQFVKKNGGIIIEIARGTAPDWYDTARLANEGSLKDIVAMKQYGIHESEWKWIGQGIDYVIHNDGTIGDLKKNLANVLRSSFGSDIIDEIIMNGD